MKKNIMTLLICSFFTASGFAQTRIDTLTVKLKIKELRQSELAIKKQIDIEDKKRNAHINDVSEENMAEINERQDSLCLSLRSDLVSVQLQRKELEKSIAPKRQVSSGQTGTLLQQGLGALQPSSASSTSSATQPQKPNKPSKPSK